MFAYFSCGLFFSMETTMTNSTRKSQNNCGTEKESFFKFDHTLKPQHQRPDKVRIFKFNYTIKALLAL
jgi:hypothetical protein